MAFWHSVESNRRVAMERLLQTTLLVSRDGTAFTSPQQDAVRDEDEASSSGATSPLASTYPSIGDYVSSIMTCWEMETRAGLVTSTPPARSLPLLCFITRIEPVSPHLTRLCVATRSSMQGEFKARCVEGGEAVPMGELGKRVGEKTAVILGSCLPSTSTARSRYMLAVCVRSNAVDDGAGMEFMAPSSIFAPFFDDCCTSLAVEKVEVAPAAAGKKRARPAAAPAAAAAKPTKKSLFDDSDFADAIAVDGDVDDEDEVMPAPPAPPVAAPAARPSVMQWMRSLTPRHGHAACLLWPITSVSTSLREAEAVLSMPTYDGEIARIIRDSTSGPAEYVHADASLSVEFRSRFLSRAFNASQRRAIEAASSGAPLTLIQGPPGTGKSTTLLGICNTVHLSGYADYHDMLMGSARMRAAAGEPEPPARLATTTSVPTAAAAPSGVVPSVVQPVVLPATSATAATNAARLPGPPPSASHHTNGGGGGGRGSMSLASLMADAAPEFSSTRASHSSTGAAGNSEYGCVRRLLYGNDPLPRELEYVTRAHALRPRMLITAPSNTAVDSIIMKIVKDGMRGGSLSSNGSDLEVYRPPILRVGEGVSPEVRAAGLFIEQQVDAIMIQRLHELQAWQARIDEERARVYANLLALRTSFQSELERVRRAAAIVIDADVKHGDAGGARSSDGADATATLASEEKRVWTAHAGRAISLVKALERCRMRGNRCKSASDLLISQASGEGGIHADTTRREIRNSMLEEAEVVFSTNSSSGVASIETFVCETGLRFNVVIMDEAAQAVEPSTLIPLRYGCTRVVLVGDPAQLPATVISRHAIARGYDRSLFARLVANGHAVCMLEMQYRSHPLLSAFPARAFYGARLSDSSDIAAGSRDLRQMHATHGFGPLVLYDVRYARQSAASSGSADGPAASWRNEAEADVVLGLLMALSRAVPLLPEQERACIRTVGVITFYRGQVELLRSRVSPWRAAGQPFSVDVNTVDGFQGQEKDVIILSCVRTGSNIGFLRDLRRMNVALTRARYACWVVADAAALRTNPTWRAFVEHVQTAGRVRVLTAAPDVASDDLVAAMPAAAGATGEPSGDAAPQATGATAPEVST